MDDSPIYNVTPRYEMSVNDRKHFLKEEIQELVGEYLSELSAQYYEQCEELDVDLQLMVSVELLPVEG